MLKYFFIFTFIFNCNIMFSQIIIDDKFISNEGDYIKIKIDDYGIVTFESSKFSFVSRITSSSKHEDGILGIYTCYLTDNKILKIYYSIQNKLFNEVELNNIIWMYYQNDDTSINLYKNNNQDKFK